MSGADEKALLQALRIRQATACDHAALADLWRRSVEATHYFLSSGEVERLFHDVHNTYLPGVEILWVAELAPCGQTAPAQHAAGISLAGFIGCNGAQVEMLFVEPRCFRHGVGRALLEHARQGLRIPYAQRQDGLVARTCGMRRIWRRRVGQPASRAARSKETIMPS